METKTSERESRSGLEFNLGREVAISSQAGEFVGKLSGIDYETGELYLLPSLVYYPDGKRTRMETEIPTTISLACFGDGKMYSIRPLNEGYMKEAVRLSDNKHKIGFSASNS